MATHGCHSCGVDLSKYTTYEESPCATCKLVNEYTNTRRAALFDSAIDTGDEEALESYDISLKTVHISIPSNVRHGRCQKSCMGLSH